MNSLDATIRNEIDACFIKARSLINSGKNSQGLALAEKGWGSIPESKFHWDVSLSFVQSMARFYRDCKLYEKAIEIINILKNSGSMDEYDDGPIFTLATVYFEKDDFENAFKFFDEANKISRGRCFRDVDKKYLAFYKSKIGI